MDHFAAFGLSARPWLDPETLKLKFFALSSEHHPDKAEDPAAKIEAEKRFASLNDSYHILRNSRSRLLHLLALNGSASQPQIQTVPENLIAFFNPIAEKTRAADELIKQRRAASSPMLKVQLFEKGLELTGDLQDLMRQLSERVAAIDEDLQKLDAQWASCLPDIQRIQNAAASLGFLDRWQAQIQQRVAALAF